MTPHLGEPRSHRREVSDDSFQSQGNQSLDKSSDGTSLLNVPPQVVTLWVHDEGFSKETVLINEEILGLLTNGIPHGESTLLLELVALNTASNIRDFQRQANEVSKHHSDGEHHTQAPHSAHADYAGREHFDTDRRTRCLCIPTLVSADLRAKHPNLELSVASSIATNFGLRNRSQVLVSLADVEKHTASHVELGFRDVYLARSDMWRLICTELVGKTVYVGQKIQFLGSIRVTVKGIHRGRKVSTAYFGGTTVPIFRSEAARFVLFIQMSQEMWDFDSEGNGEILFNRVINGFLPELFQRWSELEVRHLVSIIMFGRLEYTQSDGILGPRRNNGLSLLSAASTSRIPHKDFYRVVVTDMASAQWTTILDELKKDFRVFLRDVCLQPRHATSIGVAEEDTVLKPEIAGRPSSALKGNILEAINIAASQFANDYVDRDLVRTGVSVVVVTAGTGVYEVDRDLLNLTSENLTNNGIGIDVVCLSKMPLHSAPLFKFRPLIKVKETVPSGIQSVSESPRTVRLPFDHLTTQNLSQFSNSNSGIGSTPRSLSRYASSVSSETIETWCYGIPQWIDLSYWVPGNELHSHAMKRQRKLHENSEMLARNKRFVPRVRMYEIQMQGIEDSGLADISIPYMIETQRRAARYRRITRAKQSSVPGSVGRSLSGSSRPIRKFGVDLPNTPSKAEGLLSSNAKQQGDVYNRMNDYDDSVFSMNARVLQKKRRTITDGGVSKPLPHKQDPTKASPKSNFGDSVVSEGMSLQSDTKSDAVLDIKPKPTLAEGIEPPQKPHSSRISRTISLAFKGFAPPARAVASTEINVEHARAQPLQTKRPVGAERSLTSSSGSVISSHRIESRPQSVLDMTDSRSEWDLASPVMTIKASKPISINAPGKKEPADENTSRKLLHNQGAQRLTLGDGESASGKEDRVESSDNEDHGDEVSSLASVPKTLLPFIRNVNASNPIKRDPEAASWYGRWQHLYPRKPKAATVKWRSLCTPASVPLTTEDFPPLEKLETDYDSVTYSVTQESTDELPEHPQSRESLLQEMISIRLAHGYQLVVRSGLSNSPDLRICSPTSFFTPSRMAENSNTILLYMGNTIQKLSYTNDSNVQVTRFVRKISMELDGPRSISYSPYIRTILSEQYTTRAMSLTGFQEEYPWELADTYLAGGKKDLNNAVEKLRFWRARFVLIPIEPPASAYKLNPYMNDENEEEIHLRGISALTQIWQRNRYIPHEERHERKFKSAGRRRDPNPLEIIFRTMNPSEVVATELDIAMENPGDIHTQLLPESELLERDTITLAKLAQTMQGEKGIEIKNRRWHLRLHFNCFRGQEFINWVLQNFKDVATREEAVHFGNDLMEHGLFKHVNGRHAFKDGHFFYSMEPDYRNQPKVDQKQSWFPSSRQSQTDRSVPPTPVSDTLSRDSSLTMRSRSGSSVGNEVIEKTSSNITKGSGEKKRVSISISKMILLDVDHRKRSNRSEVVNLHYDRLHNPENCYHLELSWLNVTSKLVEDAIVSWATQSEKYGLKLVELPISEASNISNHEPFRSPYPISLVTPPPLKPFNSNPNAYFSATSFGPQNSPSSNTDIHIYQKALLKRFNFVLDLEAASEFPEDVEILYSWGKLEYRYTQFVHRSGIILAQITDNGSFLLAANRLYNSRHSAVKDTTGKFDPSKKVADHPNRSSAHLPGLQASGIIGLNPPNSASPSPSPMMHAVADVLGPRATPSSTLASYTTPEAIKDELEAFCHDPAKLEVFYKEVTAAIASVALPPRKTSSTSSSVLRAYRPPLGSGMEESVIPDIRLPERLIGSTAWQGGRKVTSQANIPTGDGGGVVAGASGEKGKDSPKRKNTG